jgi:CO dehydrogenase/acetyl-CoA synthase delta subunit
MAPSESNDFPMGELPVIDAPPSPPELTPPRSDAPWVDGVVGTPTGDVPRVPVKLGSADRVGSYKARWGVGRMNYRVDPGLYAVGAPTAESPVLVTANYKMSFDRLRRELAGIDAWILVLDTNGINVWCAAGKGTFGTEEIVRRVQAARLDQVVSHRRLVLPQLGAPGTDARRVRRLSGFRVVYGPVRAADVPAFLAADMTATPEMRRVRYPIGDRLVLIPMELVLGAKHLLLAMAAFLVLAGLGSDGYSLARAVSIGSQSALLLLVGFLSGAVVAPLLLPWVPARSFAAKGAWVGAVAAAVVAVLAWTMPGLFANWLTVSAWVLLIPAAGSFMAMNFTGVSTYTSLSGVRREMRVAVPLQIAGAAVGVGLWLVGRFV